MDLKARQFRAVEAKRNNGSHGRNLQLYPDIWKSGIEAISNKRKSGEIPGSWTGKKHSEETLVKMRESHKGLQDGEKNSQFGTCWITNGSEVKKVKNDELHRWLNSGWRKGRRKEEANESNSILRSCFLF
jgi:hypothetical protein